MKKIYVIIIERLVLIYSVKVLGFSERRDIKGRDMLGEGIGLFHGVKLFTIYN